MPLSLPYCFISAFTRTHAPHTHARARTHTRAHTPSPSFCCCSQIDERRPNTLEPRCTPPARQHPGALLPAQHSAAQRLPAAERHSAAPLSSSARADGQSAGLAVRPSQPPPPPSREPPAAAPRPARGGGRGSVTSAHVDGQNGPRLRPLGRTAAIKLNEQSPDGGGRGSAACEGAGRERPGGRTLTCSGRGAPRRRAAARARPAAG